MYFWAVKLNVLQGGTAGNKGQKRKWIWKWAMTRWRQTDSPCLRLLSYVCPKIAGRRCIVSKRLSLSVNHGVGSVLLILWDAVKQTPLHHLFYLCCTSSWRRNKRQTSAQWNHYLKTWEKRQWIRVAFALAVYRRCSFFVHIRWQILQHYSFHPRLQSSTQYSERDGVYPQSRCRTDTALQVMLFLHAAFLPVAPPPLLLLHKKRKSNHSVFL